MGDKEELQEKLNKAGEVIKELKGKLEGGIGKATKETIEKLEDELNQKNEKIVELAESVAKTQAPPKRVKLNLKYSNKYTPKQIEAFEKNGIVTTNLEKEPEPITK